jgi:hypothetical protein
MKYLLMGFRQNYKYVIVLSNGLEGGEINSFFA